MKFEDLKVWQMSRDLVSHIYTGFASCKDYGFKDQIQRAGVSIMNNIAEGFERGTLKDKKKFLIIAKGSAGEVRSMLYVAHYLQYIDQTQYDTLYVLCGGISSGLYNLSTTMKF